MLCDVHGVCMVSVCVCGVCCELCMVCVWCGVHSVSGLCGVCVSVYVQCVLCMMYAVYGVCGVLGIVYACMWCMQCVCVWRVSGVFVFFSLFTQMLLFPACPPVSASERSCLRPRASTPSPAGPPQESRPHSVPAHPGLSPTVLQEGSPITCVCPAQPLLCT